MWPEIITLAAVTMVLAVSAITATGGIDPFQCKPDRGRLSSVNFRG
jgi:hypothetical protein